MTRTTNRSNEFFIKHRDILVCLLLIMATFAVYYQVHNYGFIELDDNQYFTENRYVRGGFTIEGITWSFRNTTVGMWIPLVWISYMAGSQVYGVSSGWHHLTNVFLHLSNIILLFLIFRKLTGGFWKSAFVAALFALHPLHVESVVWITERKDVLSTFFFLLTIWMYSRYVEQPRPTRYLIAILFFALGLMAKPMLVTMPFILILLDFWPLDRFKSEPSASHDSTKESSRPLHLVLEKIPFLILAIVASTVTLIAHNKVGGMDSLDVLPFDVRITNALVSYVTYMGKMIWPTKLAVLYPHPGMATWRQVIGSSALLAGISWLAIKNVRHRPYLIVGWLWYLGTLVPVIGLAQAGTQAIADRFVYVPFIGLYLSIAWGFPELVTKLPHRKIWLGTLAAILLSILTVVTWKQVQYWKNGITLFKHTLKHTSNNYRIHNALGAELSKQGRTEEAIDHFLHALRIKPDFERAHSNLGAALYSKGRTEEAIDHYLQALRIKPDDVNTHNNLGFILYNQGRITKAIDHYLQALRLKPDFEKAHNNLGVALIRTGNIKGAISCFQEAVRINPEYVNAKNNLKKGMMMLQQNK